MFNELPSIGHGQKSFNKVYIPMARYRQLIISEGGAGVAQDLMKTIGALQDAAVGRCRKRIEDAALKAKGILRAGEQGENESHPEKRPSCGVTSILKRKHGL